MNSKGTLDDRVIMVEGLVEETIEKTFKEDQKFSLIRLDTDRYVSSKAALNYLYPRLSIGGYCIVDDYHCHSGSRRATDELRERFEVKEPPIRCTTSMYWKKEY